MPATDSVDVRPKRCRGLDQKSAMTQSRRIRSAALAACLPPPSRLPTRPPRSADLNLVWASSHIDEAVKISYYNNANSLRSIVTSTPGNAGSYSRTTSTTSNNDLAVNVPLILQTASSTSDWNATSNVTVSFLANKLTGQFGSLALATDVNGVPLDTISNGVLGGGDIKVSWRNVGLLSGSTSMQIKRSGNNCFGCSGAQTVTATLGNNTWQYDNVAIGGNPTGNSTTYYITVTNGGYTVNTQTFFFKVPTPTATGSATASRTSSATASSSRSAFPTSTATSTKTATGTATGTATASGSVTASGTPTPSNTETARASIDVAAIAAAAAEKNAGANAGAIAGAVVGTCVVILVAVVAYNVWNKKRLRSLRDRRRVASAKWATDSSAMNKAYGIREEDLHDVTRPPQQTVVMYTVNVGNGGLPGGPARGGSGSSLTTTPSRSGYAPTGKLGRGSSKGSMR